MESVILPELQAAGAPAALAPPGSGSEPPPKKPKNGEVTGVALPLPGLVEEKKPAPPGALPAKQEPDAGAPAAAPAQAGSAPPTAAASLAGRKKGKIAVKLGG